MNMLGQFSNIQKSLIEEELISAIRSLSTPDTLKESMLYSIKAGGKRIRPLLLLAVMETFGADTDKGLKTAAALEMIHTYSLIHDDLPSMDDDDLRRGLPTNHKVFGEATAILSGDALLTRSFELVADSSIDAHSKVRMISMLANAAGAEGMVGGQMADIEGENASLTLEQLESVHRRKTGRLLEFAAAAGGVMSGLTESDLNKLRLFAEHIGLAFQIRDDILDVEGNQDEIGKPVGSDEGRQKSTYPAILGMNKAKEKLSYHLSEARGLLFDLHPEPLLLLELTDLIGSRKN
ncbi:polyprenyl synthetase family protein [Jeotgalibacillus haloalkalitolerans]|uniref:Farnesyl diphosphate synthase n=1 Tax=Jeotgalibacillus haloalkalitolerans TaxID=3104292 RepID=A0ABU5KLR0_9BACL|nr:farnesyl diphosphate synthase [Jeotgalibacillus sp. HH7-29]MDZ5712120.1 farnesyl diphosphate synthase [Jeotgalibacillus sp. HH7-29]